MHLSEIKTLEDTEKLKTAILASPCASTWVQDAIVKGCQRDPVDTANDAEFVAEFFKRRCDIVAGG